MDLLSLLHQMWQSIMKSCSKILCHITVRKHKTWQCQTEGNYLSLRCLGWATSKQGLLCERPQASHWPWVGQSDQEPLVECKYKYVVNMIVVLSCVFLSTFLTLPWMLASERLPTTSRRTGERSMFISTCLPYLQYLRVIYHLET